jgi:hypothetical protein
MHHCWGLTHSRQRISQVSMSPWSPQIEKQDHPQAKNKNPSTRKLLPFFLPPIPVSSVPRSKCIPAPRLEAARLNHSRCPFPLPLTIALLVKRLHHHRAFMRENQGIFFLCELGCETAWVVGAFAQRHVEAAKLVCSLARACLLH